MTAIAIKELRQARGSRLESYRWQDHEWPIVLLNANHCPGCGQPQGPYDLSPVPLESYCQYDCGGGWWVEESYDDGIWWVGRCGVPAKQQMLNLEPAEDA